MSPREYVESREEIEEILRDEAIGYLGLSLGGQPYVVPLNYYYVDGRILFHCSLTGLKLDSIRENLQVCFTVGRQTGDVRRHMGDKTCHPDSDGVICFGTANLIEDLAERKRVLDEFNRGFTSDAKEISLKAAKGCAAVEITINEMTARCERAKKITFYRHRFGETA